MDVAAFAVCPLHQRLWPRPYFHRWRYSKAARPILSILKACDGLWPIAKASAEAPFALGRYWVGLEFHIAWNSILNYPPSPGADWFTSKLAVAQSPGGTVGMSPPYFSSSTFFLHCLLSRASKGSDAEGGPLNLPQLLVIMLAMLKFFILFLQQCIIICSHPRPLQHTSPQ